LAVDAANAVPFDEWRTSLSRQSICFYFCLLRLFVAVCVSLVVVGFCFVCCVRFALSFVDSLFIEAYSLAQHHVAQP
jgi:hypothetical protein